MRYCCFLFLIPVMVWGHPKPGLPEVKTFRVLRLNGGVTIDGYLSESAWQRPGISDFTQQDPIEGATPSQKTEVWVAYDAEALYVAARLYDSAPDSIVRRLSRRDDLADSDAFIFAVDPWHDHRTGYFFIVNAAGTIADGTLQNDGNTDDVWDGVWDSAVSMDDQGWSVEMRIPFTQLRFGEKDVHVWGMNFARDIARNNEHIRYLMKPKTSSGEVSWFAHAEGISQITTPRYLEILPYIAVSNERTHPDADNPFDDGSTYPMRIGIDLKVGLTSGMTLDLAVNPDFGQVEVDPAVVNLSDFETRYDEKRPFFIEGSSIFSFGNGGVAHAWSFNYGNPTIIYSRRMGRSPSVGPVHDYDYISQPAGTTILSAAKLTGKIGEDWTVGVFHTVTAREYARLDSAGTRFKDVVEPPANYTALRARQEFDAGRRGIGFIATSTVRRLDDLHLREALNREAYTAGIDGWTALDASRRYVLTGWLGLSRIQGHRSIITDVQTSSPHYFGRPDVDYLGVDSERTSLTGYAGRLYINKEEGKVLFNVGLAAISPEYDVNDLGFQANADQINFHIATGHQSFEPGRLLRSHFVTLAMARNWDFGGNLYDNGYFLFTDAEFLNYWRVGGRVFAFPSTLDKYHTRGGPFVTRNPAYMVSGNFRSDDRKNLYISGSLSYGRATRHFYNTGLHLNWRPNSRLHISLGPGISEDVSEAFYLDAINDTLATATYGTRYIFAETIQKNFSMTTRLNWTFTPKLSLQIYAQPLIYAVDYFDYKELTGAGGWDFQIYGAGDGSTMSLDSGSVDVVIDPDGEGGAEPFTVSRGDFNLKSLRVNAVLRWEFRPGSVFYLAWTQGRFHYDDLRGNFDLANDMNALFDQAPESIIMAKVTYWISR